LISIAVLLVWVLSLRIAVYYFGVSSSFELAMGKLQYYGELQDSGNGARSAVKPCSATVHGIGIARLEHNWLRFSMREWLAEIAGFSRPLAQTEVHASWWVQWDGTEYCTIFRPLLPVEQTHVEIPLWTVFLPLAALAGCTSIGRVKARRPGCCRRCGYNLYGNRSGICPECGEAIQVGASHRPQGVGLWKIGGVSLVVACIAIVYFCSEKGLRSPEVSPPSDNESAQPDPNVVPAVSAVSITDEDCIVLGVALSDVASCDDFPCGHRASPSPVVILHHQSIGESFYIGYQFDGELKQQNRCVPDDTLTDLRRRNMGLASLSSCMFSARGLIVADLTEIFKSDYTDEALEWKYPDAIAYVRVWLPGYSEDGRTAVVRFMFGPEPHGATGSYMLVKEGDGWKVKWRFFLYYT
jgi:hypothetical protein